jgi:hypothetical protein
VTVARVISPEARRGLERIDRDDPTAVPAPTTDTLTVPIADFLGNESDADEPDTFLVRDMLPEGVVAFLAGGPKTSKTYFALYVAVCVAAGRDVFGQRTTKQAPVVIVCEEDTVKQLRRRLWWLARGMHIDPRTLPIRISAMKGFRIDDDASFARLAAESQGTGLVVLDALTRIHSGDENSRTDMQRVTLRLTELVTKTNATALVIHHYRKPGLMDDDRRAGELMRGTGDLYALARAILGVKKDPKSSTLTVSVESNYFPDVEPFAMRLRIEPPLTATLQPGQKRRAWFEFEGNAAEAAQLAAEQGVLRVLRESREPVTVRELRDRVGGKAYEVDEARKRLTRKGQIVTVEWRPAGSGRASARWVLASRAGEFEAQQ